MASPSWLALLSPLPADAKPQRKPVASAEQLANNTAGPIAGWQNVIVYLSEPEYGLRHVLVVIDEHGQLISGGDHVMFVREVGADGEASLTEHHSVGGRFEADGSFNGTYWKTMIENDPAGDEDASRTRSAEKRAPTAAEATALRGIIADLLSRA